MNGSRHRAAFAAAFVVALGAVSAQSRDERTAAVGMRAVVEQVVLQGSELVAAPIVAGAPIVVRVLATWPHGEHFRYDLEWSGLEPGSYDLVKFLARKNGSSMDGAGTVPVTVTSLLPKGQLEPGKLTPIATQRLDAYRTLQIVAAVVWVIGLLLILFVGRRRKQRAAPSAPQPTLADRLRPLVEIVASGRGDDSTKAELERVLVACWRRKLGLQNVKAAPAIVAIREHPEAGVLLRQIEAWLHAPGAAVAIDLEQLLAPYRTMTADDLEPLPADAEAADVR